MNQKGWIITFSILFLIIVAAFVIRRESPQVGLKVGNDGTNWSSKDLNGNFLAGNDFKGQYILIDFWGSWCAPCRKEHPDLVKLYESFQNKTFIDGRGFEIVSIAIERDSSAWVKAIEKDQLPWDYHIMEYTSDFEKPEGNLTELFDVKKVPTRFLINPKGIVVGKNQDIYQLEKVLSKKI